MLWCGQKKIKNSILACFNGGLPFQKYKRSGRDISQG
jgi:hypothetical protein